LYNLAENGVISMTEESMLFWWVGWAISWVGYEFSKSKSF